MRNYELLRYKKDWSIQDFAEYIIDNYKVKNTLHLFKIIYEYKPCNTLHWHFQKCLMIRVRELLEL